MDTTDVKIGLSLTEAEINNCYQAMEGEVQTLRLLCADTITAAGDGIIALIRLWRDLRASGARLFICDATADLRAILRALQVEAMVTFVRT